MRRSLNGAFISVTADPTPTITVTATAVEGFVDSAMTSPFLGVFGAETLAFKVTSAARRAMGDTVCILGLDPTEEATIDMNGRASLQANRCAVQANSSHGTGLNQVGNPQMRASQIGVSGGFGGTNYEPLPVTGTIPFKDPYASLPQPKTSTCHRMSGAKLQQETMRLTPGTYCGGLAIKSSSVVTLEPGEYVFLDGPLQIDSQASVRGDEVMLAFLGPTSTLYLYSGAVLEVTSPTTGTYANIQFFGDRQAYRGPGSNGANGPNLWFTVIGDSVLKYDGVLYAPSFHVWFAGGSIVNGKSPNYAAIAKKLWFQDNTAVTMSKENARGLAVEAASALRYGSRLYK
jgi:hypothetical protein